MRTKPDTDCLTLLQGDFGQLELCLQEGGDISAGDYDMRTPLHIAASEGNLEMCRYLLERGALLHKKVSANCVDRRTIL